MYFQQSEHNPPHVHAIYGEDIAAVTISTGEVLEAQGSGHGARMGRSA